jgi:hypothetical protein
MAGGAGAIASASVLEVDAEILGHIEERTGLAVVLVGHAIEIHLDRPVHGQKCNFDGHRISVRDSRRFARLAR